MKSDEGRCVLHCTASKGLVNAGQGNFHVAWRIDKATAEVHSQHVLLVIVGSI